jgi:hypothetical protein
MDKKDSEGGKNKQNDGGGSGTLDGGIRVERL